MTRDARTKFDAPFRTVLIAAICLQFSAAARAQYLPQGSATWRWEASLDGGASWQGGTIETLHNPRVVLVRAIVSFEDFGTPSYLTGTRLDPYVLTNAPGDDILSLTTPAGSVSRLVSLATSPVHLPGMLKIDSASDLLQPGAGPSWTFVGQPGYQVITEPITDNPMWAMGFTLLMDDTPGDRVVQGVFQERASSPGRPIFIETRPWAGFGYAETVEQSPVTIRLVPAPASAAVAVLGAALVTGRRKRG